MNKLILKIGLGVMATGTLAGVGILATGTGTPTAAHQRPPSAQRFHGNVASFNNKFKSKLGAFKTVDECFSALKAQQPLHPELTIQCESDEELSDKANGFQFVLAGYPVCEFNTGHEVDPNTGTCPSDPATPAPQGTNPSGALRGSGPSAAPQSTDPSAQPDTDGRPQN